MTTPVGKRGPAPPPIGAQSLLTTQEAGSLGPTLSPVKNRAGRSSGLRLPVTQDQDPAMAIGEGRSGVTKSPMITEEVGRLGLTQGRVTSREAGRHGGTQRPTTVRGTIGMGLHKA